MFSIENIIFTIAGQGVSLLELLSVVAGLTCVYLATQAKSANFWVGYIYNILLFFLFLQKDLYSSMLVQPISFAINFYGHYRWTHPKKGEENNKKQLKITLLTNSERVLYLFAIAIFAIAWGWVLSILGVKWPDIFTMAKQPFLDAFVTMMILTAQYLSAQKKLDCWAVWFTLNITNIVLYILAGLAFLPLVSAGYLFLAFFGFAMWKKQWKKQGYDRN